MPLPDTPERYTTDGCSEVDEQSEQGYLQALWDRGATL
jgi:hypothetical protein